MRPRTQLAAIVGMVVCAGLLLLGVFGHPMRDPDRARHLRAVTQLEAFLAALERYKADCKQYPTAIEGLDALAASPGVKGWRGPYVAQEIQFDPWGREYNYVHSPDPDRVEITSYGADGKPGGRFFDADISSLRLHAPVPQSPFETRARRIFIGSIIGACAGMLACFVLWGFASRRYIEADEDS